MRYMINLLFVAVLATSGALLFSADVKAQGGCNILIGVETIPDSETEFPFAVVGNDPEEFTINPDSFDEKFFLPSGDTMTVTQGAVDGWVLRDITCGDNAVGSENDALFIENGVTHSVVDSGVAFTCDEPRAFINCTFINSQTETIPTLSEWGAIALVLGFGAVGYFVIRRRQVSA